MKYMPESFYKNEMLNREQLAERFKENRMVSFIVSHWDNQRRALVAGFADGIIGYIPEDEISIEEPKYIKNFEYSAQANSMIGKVTCAIITDMTDGEVILSRKKLQKTVLPTLKIGNTYNVYIKNVTTIGLFVDVAVGICGFIHTSDISKTAFSSIEDFKKDYGLSRGSIIPAKLTCLEGNIKLSFRQQFDFPLLCKGDVVYGIVRNPLQDGTGYFVELSPNDTAIVDVDENLKLYYGDRILVEIKSKESVFDNGSFYSKHHVKYIAG